MAASRTITVEPLGTVLVSLGILTETTVASALAVQQRTTPWRRLGALLIQVGLIRREDLAKALRFQRSARFLSRKGRVRTVFPATKQKTN